jgi:2-polyprenyl-3-methyl-5-hydroxy-6-metoxy-1,4-benzoquinol methylase
MNNWKKIWNERIVKSEESTVLSQLISADGFDTGYGSISEDDWSDYVNRIMNKLDISNKYSIYEVGCGAGAFLYKFYLNGNLIGGLDYSEKLINIAKKHMPNCELFVDEAVNMNTTKKFDFVVSNSVFFYFKSYEYAESVIEKMIKKSKKGILILEVNDLQKKDESIKLRKGFMSDEEYEIKYSGLEHLYYEKHWFENIAKKYNLEIEIEQQNIKNYANNNYRFNVFLTKNISSK